MSVLPAAVVLIAVIVWIIIGIIKRKRNLFSYIISTSIVIIFLTHSNAIKLIFESITCMKLDD